MAERNPSRFRELSRRIGARLRPGAWAAVPLLLLAAAWWILDSLADFLQKAARRGSHAAPRLEQAPGRHGPAAEALSLGHEPVRMNLKLLLGFAFALLLGTGILLVGLWYLHGALSERSVPIARRPWTLPRAGDEAFRQAFRSRAPGLFPDPAEDLRAFLARESAVVSGYGWADRKSGMATLPLERALDLVVERGLPRWSLSAGRADTVGTIGDARTPRARPEERGTP